jgi:hypothetical protein
MYHDNPGYAKLDPVHVRSDYIWLGLVSLG